MVYVDAWCLKFEEKEVGEILVLFYPRETNTSMEDGNLICFCLSCATCGVTLCCDI